MKKNSAVLPQTIELHSANQLSANKLHSANQLLANEKTPANQLSAAENTSAQANENANA